jgi:uncharacterized protein YdeI (BOF family)
MRHWLGFFAGVALWVVTTCVICANVEVALPALQPGTIVCDVPIEQVVREGKYMVAKEVTGKVTVTIDGHTYAGTLTFPDTKVRRTGVGRMEVDACQAKGKIR